MGAVAAILYLSKQANNIMAAVLDSPFSSLSKLLS